MFPLHLHNASEPYPGALANRQGHRVIFPAACPEPAPTWTARAPLYTSTVGCMARSPLWPQPAGPIGHHHTPPCTGLPYPKPAVPTRWYPRCHTHMPQLQPACQNHQHKQSAQRSLLHETIFSRSGEIAINQFIETNTESKTTKQNRKRP